MSLSFSAWSRAIAAVAVAAGVALFPGSSPAWAQPAAAPAKPVAVLTQTTAQHAPCRWYSSGMTLGVLDSGQSFCVQRGQRVSVALTADRGQYRDRGQWWSAIGESGRALREMSQPITTTPGTTLGRFEATRPGQATLSATRPVCPPNPGGPTCHSIQGWQVTIVVSD